MTIPEACQLVMQAANFPFDPDVDIPEGLTGGSDKSFGNLLAIDRAEAIGFGRYVISATTPFTTADLADLRRTVASLAPERKPVQKEKEKEKAREQKDANDPQEDTGTAQQKPG